MLAIVFVWNVHLMIASEMRMSHTCAIHGLPYHTTDSVFVLVNAHTNKLSGKYMRSLIYIGLNSIKPEMAIHKYLSANYFSLHILFCFSYSSFCNFFPKCASTYLIVVRTRIILLDCKCHGLNSKNVSKLNVRATNDINIQK